MLFGVDFTNILSAGIPGIVVGVIALWLITRFFL